jgi:hypothetical protein
VRLDLLFPSPRTPLFVRPSIFSHLAGDYSEGDTPVTIPNTEVKPFSADGTAWVTAWESKSLPAFITEPVKREILHGFFYAPDFHQVLIISRSIQKCVRIKALETFDIH